MVFPTTVRVSGSKGHGKENQLSVTSSDSPKQIVMIKSMPTKANKSDAMILF